MSEPTETSSSKGKPPLFAEDIPCPQCGYNLRGLIEPVCPECGFVFDPQQLRQNRTGAHRPVPITWVLGHVLPHPARFWRLPPARMAQPPSVWVGAEKGVGGPPSASGFLWGVIAAGLLGWLLGTMCWGISLYAGARIISQVSRGVAAWRVLCNPFLYVSSAIAAGLLIVLAG